MKVKTKKGYTLVEVVLSVALLALLMVPIFGMITTTFKSSQKADDRQEGSVVGQNLLEELKSNISTVTAANIPLLDGNNLSSITAAVPTYEGNIDGYNVRVVMTKNNDLGDYRNEMNTVQASRADDEYTCIVKFTTDPVSGNNQVAVYASGDLTQVQNDIGSPIDKLMLDMRVHEGDFAISLHEYYGTNYRPIELKRIPLTSSLVSNNRIKILLDDTFTGNIPIAVNNAINNIKIEIVKSKNVTGSVSVTGQGGQVTVVNMGTITATGISPVPEQINISTATFTASQNIIQQGAIDDGVGDMYKIQVEVKKDGQTIFTSEVNKNL